MDCGERGDGEGTAMGRRGGDKGDGDRVLRSEGDDDRVLRGEGADCN